MAVFDLLCSVPWAQPCRPRLHAEAYRIGRHKNEAPQQNPGAALKRAKESCQFLAKPNILRSPFRRDIRTRRKYGLPCQVRAVLGSALRSKNALRDVQKALWAFSGDWTVQPLCLGASVDNTNKRTEIIYCK